MAQFLDKVAVRDYERDLKANEERKRNLFKEEIQLNAKFHTFIVNCSLLYGGQNTVGAQLGVGGRKSRKRGDHCVSCSYNRLSIG